MEFLGCILSEKVQENPSQSPHSEIKKQSYFRPK